MDDPEAEESIESFQPSSTPEVDEGAERRGSLSKPSPRAEDLDEDQSDQNMEGAETESDEQENVAFRVISQDKLEGGSSQAISPRFTKSFQVGKRKFRTKSNPRKKRKEDGSESLLNQPSQGSSFDDSIQVDDLDALSVSTIILCLRACLYSQTPLAGRV